MSAFTSIEGSRRVLGLAVAVACISAAWAATRVNLEQDYSLADPEKSGTGWIFGWKMGLKDEFFPYPHRFETEAWGGRVAVQSRTGGRVGESHSCCPLILKNVAGRDLTGPGFRVAPGRIVMHPGPKGEYSVARWTCPAMAKYTVEASFSTLGYGTTDVHVLKNNQMLGSESLNGYSVRHDFHFSNVECFRGETFDFAVGYGDNVNYVSDSTSIRVTISN